MGSRGSSSGRKDSRPAVLKKLDNTHQTAIYANSLKVGDSIDYRTFSADGEATKFMWTFHPEGYDTFKGYAYSNVVVTDVKVTDKTVKVVGLYDTYVNARVGSGKKKGDRTIRVTKTFKKDDIVKKYKG